ncbi:hypothetical protein T11_5853 [Trichinella zimbabwensis]|uniref:Uncharacterized protein n=1 Tax=Trichinella zimbabwensis TaxID=268475 RepID=A0A0V1H8R0_9BILA|nr:hypothetical protein T11_5853 [Trichinella zimbabwensis]
MFGNGTNEKQLAKLREPHMLDLLTTHQWVTTHNLRTTVLKLCGISCETVRRILKTISMLWEFLFSLRNMVNLKNSPATGLPVPLTPVTNGGDYDQCAPGTADHGVSSSRKPQPVLYRPPPLTQNSTKPISASIHVD